MLNARALPSLTGATPAGMRFVLRVPARRDRPEVARLRTQQAGWLRPWMPTRGESIRPMRWGAFVRQSRARARSQQAWVYLIEVQGEVVGQINLSTIVRGALDGATLGYWIAQERAGQWLAPAACALLIDEAFAKDGLNLHRIECNVMPDNASSLAVVRKLGLRLEGQRQRYLHINHRWRDHLSFAVTSEELLPGGMVSRVNAAWLARPQPSSGHSE